MSLVTQLEVHVRYFHSAGAVLNHEMLSTALITGHGVDIGQAVKSFHDAVCIHVDFVIYGCMALSKVWLTVPRLIVSSL